MGDRLDSMKQSAGVAPRRVGKARVTINDIARLADVSKKTVSRVLNDHPRVRHETRLRVKNVMKEQGFTPDPQARALALRRSFLIGLAYDNPSPQYVVNIQRGILDAIDGSEYQLVLHPVDRTSPDYLQRLESFAVNHRPAGIIMPPSVSEDDAIIEALTELNCNYVRIASVELDDQTRLVRTHDAEGAAQAARYLAELGHKRIAHIHGPESFRSVHERLRGFKEGLSAFGLELHPDLTIHAGYTFDSGVVAADHLFEMKDPPTAIFAGNDEMAIGVYTSARKAGLSIPADISLVGFDDTPMASRITPLLTTVKLPIRDMGHQAAVALLRLVRREEPEPGASFRPEIVIRDSARSLG